MRRVEIVRLVQVASLSLLCGACGDLNWDRSTKQPESKPARAEKPDPILDDTVGRRTLLSGAQPVILRGFGVVVGLGDNGGGECPTAVRDYLVDFFSREYAPQGAGGNKPKLSPARLLESSDSAVVTVTGIIPPGAPKGSTFDLQIEAVGARVKTLEGGVLLACELKQFDRAAGGAGLLAGKALARGRGGVFTNPFGAQDSDTRRGFVLGGGKTTEDRRTQVLMIEPSYANARRIQNRINERFGQRPPAASALTAAGLDLQTPREYARDPARFTALVTHLYIENAPAFVEKRLLELSDHLTDAGPSLEHAAWIWEAVGRAALPSVEKLYGHADVARRFHAARAGARLGDLRAVHVLTEIALAKDSQFALLAVRELGICTLANSAARLTPLLDSADQELRIAAYEALLAQNNPAISSRSFPCAMDMSLLSFSLDVVKSRGEPLIYIRRTREPRIAVFGEPSVVRPLFYAHPEELVMLNATRPSDKIAVFCRTRSRKLMSEKILVGPRVVELILAMAEPPLRDEVGRVAGIGAHYSVVAQALGALCKDGTIAARLVVEQASTIDLLGPSEPVERPEVEETEDEDVPPVDAKSPTRSATTRPAPRGESPAQPAAPGRPE